MKLRDLVLPQRLDCDKDTLTDHYGKFVAEPFERGYGHTIGNSLRRVLLSSLEGAAVTSVKITGAQHEFSAVKGVREDVTNIILNLKQLRLKLFTSGPEALYLSATEPGPITGKDIKANSNVEILNKDLVLAHLDSGGKFEMEIQVSKGRGYVPADRNRYESQSVGTIPVDALFSPVTKVNYEVENARVGQVTDYDRLLMEVWTDGSVSPSDALAFSAKILKDSLQVFITFDEEDASGAPEPKESAEDKARLEELLSQSVEMIELSVRASNCLKVARIKTIGDLVRKRDEELLSYKNFGKKSLDEIKDRLKELGLGLGMEVGS